MRQLVPAILVKTEGGRTQVTILFHFFRVPWFLRGLSFAVRAGGDLGVIIDKHRHRHTIQLSNRIDHVSNGFTHFVIDRFVLLEKIVVAAYGHGLSGSSRCGRGGTGGRIRTWSISGTWDSTDVFGLGLMLFLL